MSSPTTQLIDETLPLEAAGVHASGGAISAYLELSKPRITFLVVVTAAAGFCLGSKAGVNFSHLLYLSAAIALLSSGIGTLNQYIERDLDRLMFRTRSRPLPAGRLSSDRALLFGVSLSVAGLATLAILINWLTAALASAAVSQLMRMARVARPATDRETPKINARADDNRPAGSGRLRVRNIRASKSRSIY